MDLHLGLTWVRNTVTKGIHMVWRSKGAICVHLARRSKVTDSPWFAWDYPHFKGKNPASQEPPQVQAKWDGGHSAPCHLTSSGCCPGHLLSPPASAVCLLLAS